VTAAFAAISLGTAGSPAPPALEEFSAPPGQSPVRENRPTPTTRDSFDIASPPPRRLRVPAIEVTASVVPTGVTARGDAEIPDDGALVGWYQYGPRPGDPRGSAVLIGHRDTREAGAGALFDIDAVGAGDRITVLTAGKALAYQVVALRSAPKQALPPALFRRDGPPRLVLITCGGPYLPEAGGYQENIYAVARPVSPTGGGRG